MDLMEARHCFESAMEALKPLLDAGENCTIPKDGMRLFCVYCAASSADGQLQDGLNKIAEAVQEEKATGEITNIECNDQYPFKIAEAEMEKK